MSWTLEIKGRRTSFALLLSLFLAGCSTIGEPLVTAYPTDYIPTAIALTVAANIPTATVSASPQPSGTATARPTITVTPTPTHSPTASRTPTVTATPTQTATPTPTTVPDIPLAAIELRSPGSLSRVTSPIPVRAVLNPGFSGRMSVELFGEDGRLLTRQIILRDPNPTQVIGLVVDLEFGIPGEAELGQLVISSADEFGRTKALTSVELILLASGTADLNPITDNRSRFVIKEPKQDDLIQGGTLIVTGLARPVHDLPLMAELVTETGQIVGFRLVNVPSGHPEDHRPFIVQINYNVTEATRARLIIRESGQRIQGTIHLVSQEVLLSP